jgi:type II secretory pathway pseudopilin PulG
MPATITTAATLPHEGTAAMDKDLGEVGLIAGIGALATWLVQRILKSPDDAQAREKAQDARAAAMELRIARLEMKLGSGSDIGSVMHTLHEMRDETRDRFDRMEKALTDLTNARRLS